MESSVIFVFAYICARLCVCPKVGMCMWVVSSYTKKPKLKKSTLHTTTYELGDDCLDCSVLFADQPLSDIPDSSPHY